MKLRRITGIVIATVLISAVIIILSVCLSGHCASKDPEPACQLNCGDDYVHWGYGDSDGPSCWGSCYETCGSGQRQSPINLVQPSGKTNFTSMILTGFSDGMNMTLMNDGHSAKVKLEPEHYMVSGLNLPGEFYADSFHFHWGDDDTVGSEHEIDSTTAPLEMHIVTYSANYSDLGEALDNRAAAVLGFMFEVSESDNPAFDDIVEALNSIEYKYDEVVLVNQVLVNLLPNFTGGHLFRYQGSLTTPGCTEGITWSVFTDTVPISSAQLQAFRSKLHREIASSNHNEVITTNYRPVQPTYNRVIQYGPMV